MGLGLSNGVSLHYFVPEILLTGFTLAVILLDLAPGARRRAGVTAAAAAVGLAAALASVLFHQIPLLRHGAAPQSLFHGMLAFDGFGTFLKAVFLLASLLLVFFSSRFVVQHGIGEGEFYGLLLACTLGMCLLASATDLLMIYLSLELVSVMSFILAGFLRADLRSSEASLKYVLYGAFASGTMIYGMSLLYGVTGSTHLQGIRYELLMRAADLQPWMVLTIVLMIFAGYGYKIAAVPFHQWCPDVYEGSPTPVTAFFSIGPKAAGLAAAARFFATAFPLEAVRLSPDGPVLRWAYALQNLNLSAILAILCVATMTWGNFAALMQNNLKRLMAYSSISHAGYMMMALVVLTDASRVALCFYLAVYLLMNLGAFLGVIVLEMHYGIVEVDQCRGLGWRAPLLGVTMTVFLFSLTGLPPTAGFIGKVLLFGAVIEARMVWLAVAGVLNSVVSLFYYARIIRAMFLDQPAENTPAPAPLAGFDASFLILLALLTVYFGLDWNNLQTFTAQTVSLLGMQ